MVKRKRQDLDEAEKELPHHVVLSHVTAILPPSSVDVGADGCRTRTGAPPTGLCCARHGKRSGKNGCRSRPETRPGILSVTPPGNVAVRSSRMATSRVLQGRHSRRSEPRRRRWAGQMSAAVRFRLSAFRWLGIAAVLAAITACGGTKTSPAPADTAPGSWARLAPMPSARQEVTVAEAGGRIYVIGGFGEGLAASDLVEAYDPGTNRWERRASLPVALHHPAAVGLDAKVLVFGGYRGTISWTALARVFEYDPAADRWRERAPMPTARGGLAAAVVGGEVHVVGGGAGAPRATHEVYDARADRWRAAPPMPTPRDHLAAVALGGRLYAIGGRKSFFGEQYAAVEVYDPGVGRWQAVAPLPLARGGLAAIAHAGRIFVFGGELPSGIVNAVEMYDPATDRWVAKAGMPTPRHGLGAAAASSRMYLAAGGSRPGLARSDVLEAFEP
jgi:N-acetylneuraminic acid mutarotase